MAKNATLLGGGAGGCTGCVGFDGLGGIIPCGGAVGQPIFWNTPVDARTPHDSKCGDPPGTAVIPSCAGAAFAPGAATSDGAAEGGPATAPAAAVAGAEAEAPPDAPPCGPWI